jgi:hypothetical protein
MSQPQSITLKHEGRAIPLSLSACRVYMAGEFAGNVELDIRCDPGLRDTLLEGLRLAEPGAGTSAEAIAWGEPGDGVELVFHSAAVVCLGAAPESLTFLWNDAPVATMEPVLVDAVPRERVHPSIDPLQILETPATPNASGIVSLGELRQPIWLLPAALLAMAGATLAVAPDGLGLEVVPHRMIAAGALVAASLVVAVAGSRVPFRRIWYDPVRRQIAVAEGRTWSAVRALVGARYHDVDGFAHIRLCQRHYAPSIGDDSDGHDEWIVSLERAIPWVSEDGRVHSRSDALELARFADARQAQQLAAEVAHALDLRVLEATDW